MASFRVIGIGGKELEPIVIPSLISGGGAYGTTGSQMSRIDITLDVSNYKALNIDNINVQNNQPSYIYIDLDNTRIYSRVDSAGDHLNLSFDISSGSSLRIRASGYVPYASGASMPTSVTITNIVIS